MLYLLEAVDEFALESLMEYKGHPFKSVEQAAADALDELPDTGETEPKAEPLSDDDKAAFERLVDKIRAILGDQIKEVRVSDRLSGSPACLASPDGVSSSMEKLMRVMQKSDGIPRKILELNPDHPLMRALLRIHKTNPDDPLLTDIVNNLYDNTLLLDGYLNDPYSMADRSPTSERSRYMVCGLKKAVENPQPTDRELAARPSLGEEVTEKGFSAPPFCRLHFSP